MGGKGREKTGRARQGPFSVVRGGDICYFQGMSKQQTHLEALVAALSGAGFAPAPDAARGIIALERLPEFKETPIFSLTIAMAAPGARQWEHLFDGCVLEAGRMIKGAAHTARIYSRKKAVERAQQEKWVATWALYDAGILPQEPRPLCERWQDVALP